MTKRLGSQVMVVTGASSGIGLCTAKRAAKAGAKVVLAARDEESLRCAVQEIHDDGGDARYVVADVADLGALRHVAEEAVRHFGRIDTWVNNAGTSIYGEIVKTPLADARRLFDVNYWGTVHGSLIAVEHLRGHGGTIVNVGSTASNRAIPLQGHYSASKHALKGFTDGLRMELEKEDIPIAVTLIMPGSIGSPYAQHATSHLDEGEPTLPPPIYAPETVAEAIYAAAERPRAHVFVGAGGRLLATLGRIAPRRTGNMELSPVPPFGPAYPRVDAPASLVETAVP